MVYPIKRGNAILIIIINNILIIYAYLYLSSLPRDNSKTIKVINAITATGIIE